MTSSLTLSIYSVPCSEREIDINRLELHLEVHCLDNRSVLFIITIVFNFFLSQAQIYYKQCSICRERGFPLTYYGLGLNRKVKYIWMEDMSSARAPTVVKTILLFNQSDSALFKYEWLTDLTWGDFSYSYFYLRFGTVERINNLISA